MRTATLWLFGVLVCAGLPRQAGGFDPADGNDYGQGLLSSSTEDEFNGGHGKAWDADAGKTAFAGRTGKSTAKPGAGAADRAKAQQEEAAGDDSGSSWIPGVSQPWILILAASGGLCLVLAPIWLAVRWVRAKRARRAGVGGRPRRARKPALAANLVQIQANRGRFAETVVAEAEPVRRAA